MFVSECNHVAPTQSQKCVNVSKFTSRTALYLIPYILITTFQYPVMKDGLNYSSPLVLMGLRYLIASLLLFAFTRSFKPIINKDTILLSIFTWASGAFWAFGLEYISTSESAVLNYTMPLMSIPLSAAILSEKASLREWEGAAIGLGGVIVYSSVSLNQTLFGAILTLFCAFFWGLYTIYYRKLKNQDANRTVASQFLYGAVLFFLFMPLDYKLEVAPNFWFDITYLSVLSGVVGFLTWNGLARLERVSKVSTLVYSIPATVTLVQSVETSTLPSPVSLFGIGLMILGICISQSDRKIEITPIKQESPKQLRPMIKAQRD